MGIGAALISSAVIGMVPRASFYPCFPGVRDSSMFVTSLPRHVNPAIKGWYTLLTREIMQANRKEHFGDESDVLGECNFEEAEADTQNHRPLV